MQSVVAGSDTVGRGRLVRVAIVDDHAAIRLGLESAIASEPGLTCVGAACDGEELAPLLYRSRPDVVIVDYQLPRANGLVLCHQIKTAVRAPAVLLYSAYADPALVVPAIVAGADGIVHKGAPARELLAAIRDLARGGSHIPALRPELRQAAAAALDAEDLPILGMLVEGTPRSEIVTTLRFSFHELDQRVSRMLARLRVPVP